MTELVHCNADYHRMINLLNNRYNSEPRRRAMLDELRKLNYSQFLDDKGDQANALHKLARIIETIVPQLTPPPHNDDRSKIKALRTAMLEVDWAQHAIYNLNINHAEASYKTFYDNLIGAEHQNQFYRRRYSGSNTKISPFSNNRTSIAASKSTISKAGQSSEIWYNGQAHYGRDRRASKAQAMSAPRTLICYNCNKSGHSVSQCRAPRDDVRIIAARIRSIMKSQKPENQVKA